MQLLIAKAMRLTAIFVTLACLQVTAKGFSQPITLSEKNVPLTKVFRDIRKQTGYNFLYNDAWLRQASKVTVVVSKAALSDVLDICFSHQPFTYSIVEKTIVVKQRIEPPAPDPSAASLPPPPITVKGRITDGSGVPLVGATVHLKGSTIQTLTNDKGEFEIGDADAKGVLVVSYVGYITRAIPIDGKAEIGIVLEQGENNLNQVVVVGYGSVRKKDLTGSVSVVDRKDFGNFNSTDAAGLLEGKAAGVEVVSSTLPGMGATIVARGPVSFNNVSPELAIIDGIEGDINSVSPDDIESITILKDASSTAIYGSRGANGVILVTTRRAKTGAPRITFNNFVGTAYTPKMLPLLNASQYVAFVKDWVNNTAGAALTPKLMSDSVLVDRTDWEKAVFQHATLQQEYLNISGGSEKFLYNASLGYTNQDGILTNYNFKRFHLRLDLEEHMGRISLGQAIHFRYSLQTGTTAGIDGAISMPPYSPVFDPNNLGGYAKVTSATDLNDEGNPLASVGLTQAAARDYLSELVVWGEAGILPGLKYRVQSRIDFDATLSTSFTGAMAQGDLVYPAIYMETPGYSISPIVEQTLTYTKTFGKHSITGLAGLSYVKGAYYHNETINGSNYVNQDLPNLSGAQATSITYPSEGSNAQIGYFGRINYAYMDKYLLTVNLRRDGSTNFGPDNRFGNFPSVAAAWRISEENFMKPLTAISDLKLRVSWGRSGIDLGQNFLYSSLVYTGASNNIVYSFGPNKTLVNGATVNSVASPNIGWENVDSKNIGLDIGLWNNHFTLTADYYDRKDNNILAYIPPPASTGISQGVPLNAASAESKGLEVAAGYSTVLGKLGLAVKGNIAYNTNKVFSLGYNGATPIPGPNGGTSAGFVTLTQVGHPLSAFYGYKVDHVAIDQNDIDKYNAIAVQKSGNPSAQYQPAAKPGDRLFKDLNGDGMITDSDQTFIGNPWPKYVYGLTITPTFKGFDLIIGLNGVAGVQIFDAIKYREEGMYRPFNQTTAVLRRWEQPGDKTDIPRASGDAVANNLLPSDWYVENGAFLRLRELTLGYTIPPLALKSLSRNVVSSLRIYVSAQNLLTITGYDGFDPEVVVNGATSSSPVSRGIDQGGTQYPHPRSYLIGINIGL